jgi:hypothetical protein
LFLSSLLNRSDFPMKKKEKWHSFLSNFHVYGGLFSVGILIAFSYSAFVHQHHPKFAEPRIKNSINWEAQIKVPEIEDSVKYKEAVRDSLGLFGHAPSWQDYKDSLGIHHFKIARPGKQYWITVPLEGARFQVSESRTGFLNLLSQLHPLSAGMQNAGNVPVFTNIWRIVMVPMSLVLLLVVILSIYFWLKKSIKKRRAWIVVGTVAFIPLLLFILIWLVG